MALATSGDSEHLAIALRIIQEAEQIGRGFIHLKETDKLLQYGGGVWEEVSEPEIGHMTDRMDNHSKTGLRREVFEKIKMQSPLKSLEEFDDEPGIINVKNGLIYVEEPTAAAFDHDPNYLSMIKLQVRYDAAAVPHAFLKFLSQILPDADDRYTVLEELASCLYRRQKWQRFYVWKGSGANGKGTLARVMQALLGSSNVTGLSLHDFQNKFNSGDLPGKLANFGSDIGEAEVKDTSLLKTITGGDHNIRVWKKHVQGWEVKGEIYIKVFFLANTLPLVKDSSEAWDRRAIVTEFTARFREDEQDKDLTAKLTTDAELSGILNVLLRVLRVMLKRGGFAHAPSIEESKAVWASHADAIQSFIMDCLVFRSDASMSKDSAFQAYAEFCKAKQFRPKTKKGFGIALADKCAILGLSIAGGKEGGERLWSGAGLRAAAQHNGELGGQGHI